MIGETFRDFITIGQLPYGPREVGFNIASVEIDNPTGSWLLLKESDIRIPPYTVNWRINLKPSARTIEIEATPPVGFNNTQAGSAIRLVCRDYELEPAQGVSLTDAQPITRAASQIAIADQAGAVGMLIVTTATERIRLYAVTFSYSINTIINPTLPLIPAVAGLALTSPGPLVDLIINAEQPSDHIVFGPGLDCLAGDDLTFVMTSGDLGGIEVRLTAVYTLL